MFPGIKKPTDLLKEIRRITKKDRILMFDGWHETHNHQLPSSVIQNILDSEIWEIIKETFDHLKCKPRQPLTTYLKMTFHCVVDMTSGFLVVFTIVNSGIGLHGRSGQEIEDGFF